MAAFTPNSCIQYRELCTRDYGMQPPSSGGRGCSVVGSSGRGLARRLESDGMVVIKGRTRGEVQKLGAFWQDVSHPTSVDMESIESLEEFEEILRVSKENSQPIIVDWMATWCRKCIYLKPKLEKLAADYPRIKFYYVDVNKVPQTLVKRGNISKMPTIQLWKDGELKAEVIGGHKAWLVLDEVRDMIRKNEEEHMAALMEEEER